MRNRGQSEESGGNKMIQLTKRERVLRTISFQETDRVPVYDIITNESIREFYSGVSMTEDNAWELTFKTIREALDMTRMIGIPNFHPARKLGKGDEEGFVWNSDRHTTWLEKRPFHDVDGLREYVNKDIGRKNKWNPDSAYVRQYRQQVEDLQKGIGDDTVIVVESGAGLDTAYTAAGMELFTYLLVDEPGLVSEWLETLNQAELRRAKAIADPDLVPVMLTYSDIAFKTGTLFSPAFLRKEFFPRLKRLTDVYHEAGVKCLFHSDGNLNAIVGDLLEAGIDGLNPIEVVAGMSVSDLRQKYGDRLFLAGGIDVSQLLPFGTPEQIRDVCFQTIKDAGVRGYFLGSTTELHPNIPAENVKAMFDAAREYTTGS